MQQHFDFVLLGGGPASVSVAETLRAEGAKGSILLVSGEECAPYGHTHLSKQFLLGAQPKEKLLMHSESYYRKQAIDTMLGTLAVAIDTTDRLVHTDRAGDIHFDKLLIATGTKAIRPAIPGSALLGIHYLHTLADAEALRQAAKNATRVVVLGGSFLGIEIATSLTRMGIHVVLIEESDLLLSQLAAPELSAFFSRYCAKRGIELRTKDTAAAFQGSSRVEAVVTCSGKSLPCDLVVVAIGVAPEIEFLRDSGIQLGDGILVNQHLETSAPGIFAAGDVANFFDIVFKERRRIEHWDNAVKQGRLAARNMLGRRLAYEEVSYFFCNILDLSFNFLGSTRVILNLGERLEFEVPADERGDFLCHLSIGNRQILSRHFNSSSCSGSGVVPLRPIRRPSFRRRGLRRARRLAASARGALPDLPIGRRSPARRRTYLQR
jgi:NADPH-dependent 2,4-dienoyl-CoA reductase/sulfur reductase-like enzyme